MIWILYARFITRHHEPDLSGYFHNLCAEIKKDSSAALIRIDEVSCKKDFLTCINDIKRQGAEISEWHFVGYGTPYGPLIGSPEWPEEISAYEWRSLNIPFSAQAKASFHMEGSAVWLAPFLASAYKITCHGCNYLSEDTPPKFCSFEHGFWKETADYNPIATLYAKAFSDITVRRDECRWLEKKLLQQNPGRVLDIGCGNGALLAYLAPYIKQGTGVDISSTAIKIAARNNADNTSLSFLTIDGPILPFADNSFDTIISMLSFRYLDWDPIIQEMKRVAAPGAHILVVDMVSSPLKLNEWPSFIFDKLKNSWLLKKRQPFKKTLVKLVSHPSWKMMIRQHPMHLQNEFAWYLKSRFPLGEMTVLNTGLRAKILAFDSGPIGKEQEQEKQVCNSQKS